jgi:hypothetical protein
VNASGLSVDPKTGQLTVHIERIDPGSFHVEGATANWPGEPFIRGPWREAEPFDVAGA